jgi:hypothetical protein
MSRRTPRSRPNLIASTQPSGWAARLTQLAFIVSLALIIARAFMSETVRDPFDFASAAGLSTPRGPGPSAGVLLDALECLPALLVLLRRVFDREYPLRWAWSQVLFAAFAVWCAASVLWASDRFFAAVTAAHMIAAAALIWSTAQLVRSTLRLRIIAGVCFGILLAYLAQGLIYRFVDVPDNVRYFQEHKTEILQQHDWEPDSFAAAQFEKKLTSGEMIGFNQSPNSFAAVIVMLLVISAGTAIQRRANGDALAWMIPVAIAGTISLLILYYTGSRTAFGTLLIACAILIALRVLGGWLNRHRTRAFLIALGCFCLAWGLLIGHGVYHGSLPQDSLNFRWRYWVAAARLFTHHPLLGVGWSNFGNAYLAYRLPTAAEEVRDPHNYIVRAFVELGIIGGILLLGWILRLAWELTRPAPPLSEPACARASRAARPLVIALGGSLIGGMLLNVLAAVDFNQSGSYLLLEVFRRVLWTGLITVGVLLTVVRSMQRQEMDDRPAGWLINALLVALVVFFIHNLVDFSLAEPGPLMLFALLVGAAEGIRFPAPAPALPSATSATSPPGGQPARRFALGALLIGAVTWLAGIGAFVIPVCLAEDQAHASDDALRAGQPERAAALLNDAESTMPLNADYAYRAARALMLANRPPQQVRALLDAAIAKDSSNPGYQLTRAGYEMTLPPDLRNPAAVRRHFEQALALDPMSVASRIDYADALEKLGNSREAARQLREALRRNDQLNPDEPKRLKPQEVHKLTERARRLEQSP